MVFLVKLLPILTFIATLVLIFAAINHLNKQAISSKEFWVWAMIVLFMPLIGSIMVFIYFDKPRYR